MPAQSCSRPGCRNMTLDPAGFCYKHQNVMVGSGPTPHGFGLIPPTELPVRDHAKAPSSPIAPGCKDPDVVGVYPILGPDAEDYQGMAVAVYDGQEVIGDYFQAPDGNRYCVIGVYMGEAAQNDSKHYGFGGVRLDVPELVAYDETSSKQRFDDNNVDSLFYSGGEYLVPYQHVAEAVGYLQVAALQQVPDEAWSNLRKRDHAIDSTIEGVLEAQGHDISEMAGDRMVLRSYWGLVKDQTEIGL